MSLRKLGGSGPVLRLGLDGLQLQLLVRELDQDGVRLNGRAGQGKDALDASLRCGSYEPDLLRHQRADPPNLTEHVTTRHGIDPDRRAVHRESGGVEGGDAEGG